MSRTQQLLKRAFTLVETHGFTREALAQASVTTTHSAPLSQSAVSALFGDGVRAEETLFRAWLREQIGLMSRAPQHDVRGALHHRLTLNEPVLPHLPRAFALLTTPAVPLFPPWQPLPLVKHTAEVADEACYIGGDTSTQLQWYVRRASLAAAYGAAELHQLQSPHTAHGFLDSMIDTAHEGEKALYDVRQYGNYIIKSWAGIIKSSAIRL
ncbi:hypothetical protein FISHEDRAFT_62123 [Fistulina hepatica ATCC 64428]|nr:hypothetical protein FISHEDRAFT_62123 [Fistulina hepatica ATCC 64428]